MENSVKEEEKNTMPFKLQIGSKVFVLHNEKVIETFVDKIVTTELKTGTKVEYGLDGIMNTVWLFPRKKLYQSRKTLVDSL